MIAFVGLEMQVGHIQIIIRSCEFEDTEYFNVKLDFSATRPG